MNASPLTPKAPPVLPFFRLLLAIAALVCLPWRTPLAADAKQQFLTFPVNGAYCGAFLDFGISEDKVTLEAIEKFERMVGKHQAIIASSSFWGELTFPAKNVSLIVRHGSLPLIFWSPWDRPYVQEKPPDRFGLEEILAGKWDAYIDQWALAAKEADTPLLVSWGLEMNGNWFPWSGCWYGGEHPGASGLTGPELFVKAYRYVVDRVRARGAANILWGFHANHYTYPHDGWNRMSRYYPGSEYVDWLGLSVYGKQFAEDDWASFRDVMEEGYQEIALLDQEKPLSSPNSESPSFRRTAARHSGWMRLSNSSATVIPVSAGPSTGMSDGPMPMVPTATSGSTHRQRHWPPSAVKSAPCTGWIGHSSCTKKHPLHHEWHQGQRQPGLGSISLLLPI